MPARMDIKGEEYNSWTVLSFSGISSTGASLWKCRCVCGRIVVVQGRNLLSGSSRSCRVCSVTRHGLTYSRAWRSWTQMKDRCRNKNSPAFKYYGGRGIKICLRWYSFENFYKDMGDRPKGMSLHRLEESGDYTPSNCIWATSEQQASWKRSSHHLFFRDQLKTISRWAKKVGIGASTIWARLSKGWSIEKSLTFPVAMAGSNQFVRRYKQ